MKINYANLKCHDVKSTLKYEVKKYLQLCRPLFVKTDSTFYKEIPHKQDV